MDVVRVTSADVPLLTDYLSLTDVELRRRKEPTEGLFLAEGELVIRRALAAGYAMRSMLLSDKWLPVMADVAAAAGAPVYVADDALLESVTGFAVHRGALASMQRRALPSAHELLATASRVAVLEDVNNHTNVGAIFRCAAALGIDAALLSPSCGDPLYRRSVKVSMGTVFAVPYARLEDWPGGLATVRAAGFPLLALTPRADATSLRDLPPEVRGRHAVLLGSEGTGLTDAALAAADMAVCIPMAPGVDSLNVAAAAAVAFYGLQ